MNRILELKELEKTALLSRLWQQCGFALFCYLVEMGGFEPLSKLH